MIPSFRRSLYSCMLRLHPPSFQREFADQMLWIFDEVAANQGTSALFVDAALSLLRQWIIRGALRELLAGEITVVPVSGAGADLFAWEHINVPQASLPLSRVFQGTVLSVGFLAALSFAAF